MTMYNDLIEKLRADEIPLDELVRTIREAADVIEELSKVSDAVNDAHNEGYDAGYWAGRRDYEPKWIPVTERLPGKNDSYLVCVYGEVTEMNFWHGKWHRRLRDDYTKVVTHWMPLPQPPKE